MSSNMDFLSACSFFHFSSIIIGDGSSFPISCAGQSYITNPHTNFLLRNILVAPSLIKNLIFVRRFTIDNNVSLEFDPFGLSVKDLKTVEVLARYNSSGDLYPLHGAPSSTPQAMHTSVDLWRRRSATPIKILCRLCFKNLVSLLIVLVLLMTPLFVMPVNAANMLDCLSAHQLPIVLFHLSYCIVIYGPLHFLLFLVSNTILLFLTIILITYGTFLFAPNPMCTQFF